MYARVVFILAKPDNVNYFNRLQTLKYFQYEPLEEGLLLVKTIYSVENTQLREVLWSERSLTLIKAIDGNANEKIIIR